MVAAAVKCDGGCANKRPRQQCPSRPPEYIVLMPWCHITLIYVQYPTVLLLKVGVKTYCELFDILTLPPIFEFDRGHQAPSLGGVATGGEHPAQLG